MTNCYITYLLYMRVIRCNNIIVLMCLHAKTFCREIVWGRDSGCLVQNTCTVQWVSMRERTWTVCNERWLVRHCSTSVRDSEWRPDETKGFRQKGWCNNNVVLITIILILLYSICYICCLFWLYFPLSLDKYELYHCMQDILIISENI